jgi:hypothetical protein
MLRLSFVCGCHRTAQHIVIATAEQAMIAIFLLCVENGISLHSFITPSFGQSKKLK